MSVKYIGLDVHQATIYAAVMDPMGKKNYPIPSGDESRNHSGILCRTARNFVGNVRRRNQGGLALRSAQTACGQLSGVQPAQDRFTPTWQQKRQDRCPQTGDWLCLNDLESVYHGETGVRMLRELARSYLTIVKKIFPG